MIPDRKNQVRVRSNFEGWVEVLVRPGQVVGTGDALVEVEGDGTLERLCARAKSTVVSVEIDNDTRVPEATLLVVLQEHPKEPER